MRRNRLLLSTLLIVLLCASLILSGKADATNWVQNYGGANMDSAHSVIETSDGGYALAGVYNYSWETTIGDFWLVKTDAAGNMEWNQTYGGAAIDRAYSLVNASDGGYALAGFTESLGAGDSDFWLVKTDSYGNMEWNKTYGGTGNDCAYSLIATYDGGYALAGFTESLGAGGSDFWLVKTDSYGNEEWNITCGGAENDVAHSLVEASDGGYAMAGVCDRDATYFDYFYFVSYLVGDCWLVKTDSYGNMEWNQTYGGTGYNDAAHALVATSDGGFALAGVYNGSYLVDGAFWLIKTNATGNMEWNMTYIEDEYDGWTGDDIAFSLVETSDGGYALAGAWNFLDIWVTYGGFIRHSGFWLVKTDALGNAEWNQTYGGGALDVAYSLVATSDGGYALAGVTTSFGVGGLDDFWLVKTDEDGVAPVEPEAPWFVLPFLLAATVSIFICKKKLLNSRSEER